VYNVMKILPEKMVLFRRYIDKTRAEQNARVYSVPYYDDHIYVDHGSGKFSSIRKRIGGTTEIDHYDNAFDALFNFRGWCEWHRAFSPDLEINLKAEGFSGWKFYVFLRLKYWWKDVKFWVFSHNPEFRRFPWRLDYLK